MQYQVEWHEATLDEFKNFSKKFRDTIRDKIKHIADNLPASLKLRSIQPIRDQDLLPLTGTLYELDIASGAKAAFVVDDDRKVLIVYMVGKHDYAYSNYTYLAKERLAAANSSEHRLQKKEQPSPALDPPADHNHTKKE